MVWLICGDEPSVSAWLHRFWNRVPDDQFTNTEYLGKHLAAEYHTIDKADQLGDVIFLVNAKGDGIHSATYVADGIVFTKNGSSMSALFLAARGYC